MRIKLNEIEGFEELADYYMVVRENDLCWVEGMKGKILKSVLQKTGYKLFVLYQKDGKNKGILEHRLFASCFIPNPEMKPCVNHIDNCRSNNLLSNLEWCTHRENTLHSVSQNRWGDTSGENHGNCKISDEQVEQIFELRKTGLSHQKIADLIGCSRPQISYILSGKSRSKKTKLI